MFSTDLSRLLRTPDKLVRLAGSHNALSAKVAERAGFDGVWASSLEISTSMGCTDTGANTMTHILSATTAMAAAVDCPVVADCGPAIGGSPGVAQMINAFESAGAAAACMEDSLYPKTNSLLPGRHDLVGVDQFSEYIRTAIQSRENPDFLVIARIEALIAGESLGEALKRAHSYANAGADAILPHSKAGSSEQVLGFAAAWESSVPLVLIPTTYYSITEEEMRETHKVKIVIYANQGIRAAVHAMKNAYGQILHDGSTSEIQDSVAPLEDLFGYQALPGVNSSTDQD